MFYDGYDEIENELIPNIEDEISESDWKVKTRVMNGFHKFTTNFVIKNKLRSLNIIIRG